MEVTVKLGHIAVGGAAGIMSLGLIGFGAHAAFTTTASATQKFTTGTPSLVMAPYGTNNYGQHLTFGIAGPYGSTFLYSKAVTLLNNGNIAETVTKLTGAITSGSLNAAHLHACIFHGTTVLDTGDITGTVTVTLPLATGATYSFTVDVYAGMPAGLPGFCTKDIAALPNTTSGKTLTDTLTAQATG